MSGSCFVCGENGTQDKLMKLDLHHIFGGNPNRKKSDEHGLVVMLCAWKCHNGGPESAHKNREAMQRLHKYGQRLCMYKTGWTVDKFRQEFGKNHLDEEEFDESGRFIGEVFF